MKTKINCLYVTGRTSTYQVILNLEQIFFLKSIVTIWGKNGSHVLHKALFVMRWTLLTDTLNNCYQQTLLNRSHRKWQNDKDYCRAENMLSMVELQRRTTKPFGTSPAGQRLLASRSISDSSNCLKNKALAKCMSVFVCVISMPDGRRGCVR